MMTDETRVEDDLIEQAKQIPVYSCYLAYHDSPEEIVELNLARVDYPPLPWSMAELVGTEWRNVHTGSVMNVNFIGKNRFGRLEPYQHLEFWGESPGFWASEERFVIEHWVRVDHLAPEVHLKWLAFELARTRSEEARHRDTLKRMDANPHRVSCYSSNRRMTLGIIERMQRRADKTIERMHEFAETHSLEVGPELLNAGMDKLAEVAPAQLQMF